MKISNKLLSKNNAIFAGSLVFSVIVAKFFSFPLIASVITGGALSLFMVGIYRWMTRKNADNFLQDTKQATQTISTPANIASKLNVTQNDLSNEQQPLVQQKVNDDNIKTKRLFALDFDETITIKHTFPETQLALVRVVANTKQRDYAFQQSKTDQQVMANLRNLEQTKSFIKDVLVDDCLIVVTRHNNIEWVKRNLRLLLNNDHLANKIEVYALQHPIYNKFPDKLDAMHGHIEKLESDQSAPVKISAAYLVDNDMRECKRLKAQVEQQKIAHPNKFANFTTIHADENDDTNAYLEVVRGVINRTVTSQSAVSSAHKNGSPPTRG